MSTSIAVQPAIAASSSSVGVKSVSPPVPKLSWPPRSLVAVNTPWATRSTVTLRCTEPLAIPLPCQATGGDPLDEPQHGRAYRRIADLRADEVHPVILAADGDDGFV